MKHDAMRDRTSRAAGIAVLTAFAVLALLQVRGEWWFQDSEAYWQAAIRLRAGNPLYPALVTQDASSVYRYAPWFAFAWVPLTLLPKLVALSAWSALLAAATAYCAWLPLRHRSAAGAALAILAAALLIPAAASGNVQPLLVASLMWGVERKSGPLWIAAAASLKAAPLLLVVVFLGRRQWWRAALTFLLSALLVAPMLLFDLTQYPTETAAASGPLATWLSIALGFTLAVAGVTLAGTRFGWLAAAAAVVFAIPRWSYYQPSMLLIGLAQKSDAEEMPG